MSGTATTIMHYQVQWGGRIPPEIWLARISLARAICDAFIPLSRPSHDYKKMDAWNWIMANGMTFNETCECAGYEPNQLRTMLVEWQECAPAHRPWGGTITFDEAMAYLKLI